MIGRNKWAREAWQLRVGNRADNTAFLEWNSLAEALLEKENVDSDAG